MVTKKIHNVFIIPVVNKQFIVYLPLHGIIFSGNSALVNHFYKALSGDECAQTDFGLSPEEIKIICENGKRLSMENRGNTDFKPTSVSLFLTTDCSMACTYCYANAGEKKIRIKKEFAEVAIKEIIKNAVLSGRKKINLNYHGGGDIGVSWDLVEEITEYALRKAKEHRMSVHINVGLNGVLSDHQRDWIIKNTDYATVSIDGFSEIQNRYRPLKDGSPSFDLVHNTLKYFDKHNYNYGIRSTITADTVGKLDEIITFFCTTYNARKIKVEPVSIRGRALKSNLKSPSVTEFVKNFLKAQESALKYNKELLYSGAGFDMLSTTFCKASGASFCITPEGYITSCYEVLERSDPLSDTFFYGQIKNGEILIDQNKLNHLASLTVENKEKCRNCFAKYHCAGDCPSKSLLAINDFHIKNYRCSINRELTKGQLLNSIEMRTE